MMATPPPGSRSSYAQAGPNDETGPIDLHSLDYREPIEEQSPSTSSLVATHNPFPFPVPGDSTERDSRLKEKVREVMASMKQERDDELEELKRERDRVREELQKKQDELNSKEVQLVLEQEKHKREMAEQDEKQRQEILKEREAKESVMRELEASKEDLKEKEEQLQDKDSKIATLEASNNSLKKQVDNLTARNEELERNIRDLQQEIRALNQNMETIQGDNAALKQDCVFKEELSATIHEIEERTDRLDAKMDEKIDAALKTKIAEIMSQLTMNNNVSAQAAQLRVSEAPTTGDKLQTDYKRVSPKSRSKTPSPSGSPINFLTAPPVPVETNNLNQ